MKPRRANNDDVQWIALPDVKKSASVVAGYALTFEVHAAHSVVIEVTADQQYELYLDGEIIGRGSESGTPDCWFYDSQQLTLSRGSHVLAAMVWSWGGRQSAMAQMEVFHGLYLSSPEKATRALLGTGVAPWKVKQLRGIKFTQHLILPHGWTGVPPSQTLEAKHFPWCWTIGASGGWKSPAKLSNSRNNGKKPLHHLTPAKLPAPVSEPISQGSVVFVSNQTGNSGPLRKKDDLKGEHAKFEALIAGGVIILPAGTQRKILFDLENYFCVYPSITTSGGKSGRVRLTWAESLFEGATSMQKGNRNAIWNKFLRGIWDEFHPDGGDARKFKTLTWRAGRYLELTVESGAEPLKLELKLQETRFPLPMRGGFFCDNDRVNEILPICIRSLEMSSHDNFVDCPFYERLAYTGDGRLEALAAYTFSGDDVLARKAIGLFASSAEANGLCMSRWPSREVQYIPTFALWWIGMVYDFSLWRNDRLFVRSALPAIRTTLDYFLSRLDGRQIYAENSADWNFVDWVPEWNDHPNGGVPPAKDGVNMLVNCLLKYTLSLAAKLESYAGSPTGARKFASIGTAMGRSLHELFWDPDKKLYKDDGSGLWFSEHTQVMAILSGLVSPHERKPLFETMIRKPKIVRTSLFFTHYFFEAGFLARQEDLFFKRLESWNGFLGDGFKTVPENFVNSRSDCHGWGAHPLFHLVANVAGIRPSAHGFKKILVVPNLGKLKDVVVTCPHPAGLISASYRSENGSLVAKIQLPQGLSGDFVWGAHSIKIGPGSQTLRLQEADGGLTTKKR